MLRFLTAGESHGEGLVAIVEGLPAGVPLLEADVDADLARRQAGHGRGARMTRIERDRIRILSGVRKGRTLGSPIALLLLNKDWEAWRETMSTAPGRRPRPETLPRPGHGDLAGALKYGATDVRDILERASARETAARVAAGAACRAFLRPLGIEIASHVVRIGRAAVSKPVPPARVVAARARIEGSPVRCYEKAAERAMVAAVDAATAARDTVGGVVEGVAVGVPVGLGSHVHWDRKLDGRLAQAAHSIPAIKGVEIGLGFGAAALPGSRVHDEIFWSARERRYVRRTNSAGGLEAGIANGEPIVVRAAMKPLSTLRRPLRSVDIRKKTPGLAIRERSDVCAVPAAGVVLEAVIALVLADAVLEKFGGDSLVEVQRNLRAYARSLAAR